MQNFDKITYTNHFKIEERVFAFRKKLLFDITNTPHYLPIKINTGVECYWINRKWFSLSKIKSFIINDTIEVDISRLQWYTQINLIECFNL